MPTGDSGKEYAGEVTTYVIVACIVAASGGALFGYVHHAILSAKVLSHLHHASAKWQQRALSTKTMSLLYAGMTMESQGASFPW